MMTTAAWAWKEATVSLDCRSFARSSRGYTAAVECALTFKCIVAVITLVYGRLTARWLPIAILKFNVLRLLFASEHGAGTNYMYMHHTTFQPSCYCPVTQRRQQAVLNNLEKYNQICTKNSEHNVWMHCSDRVWLTIAKIPTSRHNIAVFLLLWKLSVNCKQLALAGEVQYSKKSTGCGSLMY